MIRNITILLLLSLSFGQFQPQTKAELQTAVDLWVDDNAAALSIYGEINTWDVSLITNMNGLFFDESWNGFYDSFNDDIGNWDVSNVTNMAHIFKGASSFNGNISGWDVSSVTDMSSMFWDTDFNGDISDWDVSNVTNMYSMFSESFNV